MKPTLLILAAGVGSRYGGLKQLDKIGPSGETIIDYSIYDAMRAGFGKIIFIIKEAIEDDFKEAFVERLADKVDIDYVFQETWMVPDGITVPENRTKPWGTGHAVLMADGKINQPFAVINGDDFYGRDAFQVLADFYGEWTPQQENKYCMVGYKIANTLSEFGSVSRGICQTDANNLLLDVVERTHIERKGHTIFFKVDSGEDIPVEENTVVSMNFWGFTPSLFGHLKKGFDAFIRKNGEDPKSEFYIPSMVNTLIKSGKATVKVLESNARWFGMTYREDRIAVVKSIRQLVDAGEYPENLWA